MPEQTRGQRMDALTHAAAEAMEAGCSPFDPAFLRDHHVTLTEAYEMGEQMGRIIRGFLRFPKSFQAVQMMLAVSEGLQDWPPDVIMDTLFQSYYLQQAAKAHPPKPPAPPADGPPTS